VQIIVELMTNQWNAILVEDAKEWIRHLLWKRRSEDRDLSPGQAYRGPEPSSRKGILRDLTREEWDEGLRGPEPLDQRRILLETVAFTSPINVTALLADPDPTALWKRLRSLEAPAPCLLETDRGKQPYPIVLYGFKYVQYQSILEAVEAVAGTDDDTHRPKAQALEELNRALGQAQGKFRGIERELKEAADPEVTREKANLILARLGEIQKGAAQVTLRGFKGEKVLLSLDPSLSPHENAEALYREASRQERVRDRLPALLEEARGRVAHFNRLLEAVRAGEMNPEEAKKTVPARGRKVPGQRVGTAPRLPFKRFRSSGGLEILVGRGPTDNDELTFKHARPNDVWLHAREAGGAHVVLRWNRKDPPPGRDLSEAAVLAALHSRSRHAGVVPVDWTRRKHVRRPRKAPPGTVRLDETSTLFVEPDSGLMDRLSWDA
jgi:predicted ribosome quality control (RQC) complex YloA/Tae2 family protein